MIKTICTVHDRLEYFGVSDVADYELGLAFVIWYTAAPSVDWDMGGTMRVIDTGRKILEVTCARYVWTCSPLAPPAVRDHWLAGDTRSAAETSEIIPCAPLPSATFPSSIRRVLALAAGLAFGCFRRASGITGELCIAERRGGERGADSNVARASDLKDFPPGSPCRRLQLNIRE